MARFFDETDDPLDKKTATKTRAEQKIEVYHQHQCDACPLNRAGDLKHPKMDPYGPDDAEVYILGEAPGAEEDAKGRPWVGKAGIRLEDNIPLGYLGLQRYNNCVRTRPTKGKANRTPTWVEIECCRPSVISDIEKVNPKAIFAMGAIPLNWTLGIDHIMAWRGTHIPTRIGKWTGWVFPMIHPSFIERMDSHPKNESTVDYDKAFKRDLKDGFELVSRLGKAMPEDTTKLDDHIICVDGYGKDDFDKVEEWFDKAYNAPVTSLDYETNGIRPYRENPKILSVAISMEVKKKGQRTPKTMAIALDHPDAGWTPKELKDIKNLLSFHLEMSKGIKAVHNLHFEQEWSAFFFGPHLLRSGVWGDTMAQAYCLDERHNGERLRLDKVTLRLFGFQLKEFSNVDVANLITEPLDKVLMYNGRDAKYTLLGFMIQNIDIVDRGLTSIYDEQIRRVATMVKTQLKGLVVNQTIVGEFQDKLEDEMEVLANKIQQDKSVKEFLTGRTKFNPASNTDCLILFRDILGHNVRSVGEKVLSALDLPLAKDILDLRSTRKKKSTYVDPHAVGGRLLGADGRLHTSLNTVFTVTGRLSASDPNVQNFPIRGKDSHGNSNAWIRQQIEAPKDHFIVALDYGAIEIRVIAMASKDPTLIAMLWDNVDIHYDWAVKLANLYPDIIGGKAFLKDEGAMKELRQNTKSNFVFPTVYGAQPPSISYGMGVPEDKIQQLQELWWETFPVIRTWQDKVISDYERDGYTSCLTGRRRHTPLARNHIVNSPIQGTASDIVVDAMTRLSERGEQEDCTWYQAVMNIHDDLTFYVPKSHFSTHVGPIIEDMLTVPYTFVNVPIVVEMKRGTNWYEMKEIGDFYSNE